MDDEWVPIKSVTRIKRTAKLRQRLGLEPDGSNSVEIRNGFCEVNVVSLEDCYQILITYFNGQESRTHECESVHEVMQFLKYN